MIAKLIVEGKEFDIEILDPELQKLIAPKKKTGYERVENGQVVWLQYGDGSIYSNYEYHDDVLNDYYEAATYYSDKTVAENNNRADTLMRQLRRFAVEHRRQDVDWKKAASKYLIRYDYVHDELYIDFDFTTRDFGAISFDLRETAVLAIQEFHDELIWYFTEYKDSL